MAWTAVSVVAKAVIIVNGSLIVNRALFPASLSTEVIPLLKKSECFL